MILDYTTNPLTKVKYTFPRTQIALNVPNERRNPVFVVPGGGGPVNPKGTAPFDREPNLIVYRFRVTPRRNGESFDAARERFIKAVDHGRPQTLNFLADDGRYWQMTGVLVRDPLAVDINAPYYADFEVAWVGTADLLSSPITPGAAIYGTFKYGTAKKYGAASVVAPLTTNRVTVLIDNSTSGATASTTDPVITLNGPWGPATPSITNGISLIGEESGTSLYIVNTTLNAGDTLTLDLASRRILYNGAPAFATVFKAANQRYYLEFLHDTVNHLTLAFGGAPLATLNGRVSVKWKPKRGF